MTKDDIAIVLSYKNRASVDRIDSTKGYVEGNIQWVHKDINKIKYTLSLEEFIDLCKQISVKHNEMKVKI